MRPRSPKTSAAALVAIGIGFSLPLGAEPSLQIEASPAGGMAFAVAGDPARSQRLEMAVDGDGDWWVIDAGKGESSWEAAHDGAGPARLFRAAEAAPPSIAPHEAWKARLDLADEPFLSENLGESFETVRWCKFAVLLDDATEVYFQDSRRYLFHYDFATERLAPFAGMTTAEFDAATLPVRGRRALLGAVLVAPFRKEFAVQVVGDEPFPRESLRFLYHTVEAKLDRGGEWRGYLMPVPAHAAALRRDADWFEAAGIPLAEPDRWSGQGGCYVEGWALGRLRYVAHDGIEAAYLSGALLPTDILVTDWVPAELPFLAGILSLSPSTPNSHVAILAESYGVSFGYLATEPERQAALALDGHQVALRISEGFYDCAIRLLDAGAMSDAYRDEILALKAPPPLAITPKVAAGAIAVADLSGVWPEDIGTIGGKAANFGFLRRGVPANSPEAVAFTFDLWDGYLDQALGERSLRAEIAARLAPYSSWPPDIAGLDATLAGVRDLIEDEADFTSPQRAGILAALAGFDPMRKLRFRSSTNVEDSGVFVGAGLYDSFSGCVMDDTDGDEAGPSHCDPQQPEERGVFRAMRKVYASFYNRNAYLERLRHGVDEAQVGMALLVHHSFPDEIEAANGVATVERRPSGGSVYTEGDLVSQLGAVSVTNPEGGAVPEVVRTTFYRGNFNFEGADLVQRSSLLLLGEEAVMGWQDDYLDFAGKFHALGEAFVARYPENPRPLLEYEYKKLTDGSLVIKQMREVPAAPAGEATAMALIGSPATLEVFQGETGTAMGNHRLKSLWGVRGDDRWVPRAEPGGSLLAAAEVESAIPGGLATEVGPPAIWPGHGFTVQIEGNAHYARDSWDWSTEAGATRMWLQALLPEQGAIAGDPLRSFGDLTVYFGADYPVDVLEPGEPWNGSVTRGDVVLLVEGHPDDPPQEGSELKVREGSAGGINLRVEFYWPPAPNGPVAGYTAPLEKWEQTTITGLTSEPVVLRGYYSQTYRPGHHNFTEDFVFEPRLEEGISAAQLAELEAADVRMIYWTAGSAQPGAMRVIGLNGKLREL